MGQIEEVAEDARPNQRVSENQLAFGLRCEHTPDAICRNEHSFASTTAPVPSFQIMAGSFAKLSKELLDLILSELEPEDLTALMRTSKALLPAAKPLLYHTVEFNLLTESASFPRILTDSPRTYDERKSEIFISTLVNVIFEARGDPMAFDELDLRVYRVLRAMRRIWQWGEPDNLNATLISRLSIPIDAIAIELLQVFESIGFSMPVARLLDACSTDYVTELELIDRWLGPINRFQNLKVLRVKLVHYVSKDHERTTPSFEFRFPALETLDVHCCLVSEGEVVANQEFEAHGYFLEILLQLLERVPHLKNLIYENQFYHHSDINGQGSSCPVEVSSETLRNFEELELGNLEFVDINCSTSAGQTFFMAPPVHHPRISHFLTGMGPRFTRTQRGILTNNSTRISLTMILSLLVNKHLEHVKRISWGGIIIHRSTHSLLPFSSARRIKLRPRKETARVLTGRESSALELYAWFDMLADNASLDLNRLTLDWSDYHLDIKQPFDFAWFRNLLPRFGGHIRLLSLKARSGSGFSIPGTENWQNIVDFRDVLGIFGVGDFREFASCLPPQLEVLKLAMYHDSLDTVKDVPAAAQGFLELFHHKNRLHALAVTLNKWRMCQKLVFERRPGDAQNPSDASKKKVLVWHLKTRHKPDKRVRFGGHFVVAGYQELKVRKMEYMGSDGEPWPFTKKEAKAIRECKIKGVRRCEKPFKRLIGGSLADSNAGEGIEEPKMAFSELSEPNKLANGGTWAGIHSGLMGWIRSVET